MKVVLFCGGLGTRLSGHAERLPKPLVEIGYRPIMWHLMKYYAHYGHRDFILCLGYKGDAIKEYFLNYSEFLSNDFTLVNGGREVKLHSRDIEDWKITFVDTGINVEIGERLRRVESYLDGDDVFLANYSDGLTDLPLDRYIEDFASSGAVACFLSVRPSQSFHAVTADENNFVTQIEHIQESDFWINGGFLILRREIFDYIEDGDDLVPDTFPRLIKERRLTTYRYRGFWASMDTFKDKMRFDAMYEKEDTPWTVWEGS